MASLIKPQGTKETITGTNKDGSLSLEQLQSLIGGYVEMLHCDPNRCDGHDHVFIDEDGKSKDLKINVYATQMLAREFDPLRGNALFCKFKDGESF